MNILAPHTVAAQEVAGRSLWQDALARLARNRAAVVSLVVLAVIALMALLAPWISPHPFDELSERTALHVSVGMRTPAHSRS